MVGNTPGIATTLGKCLQEVQPSTAAAEKVFSILTNTFGQLQTPSLEDYYFNFCYATVYIISGSFVYSFVLSVTNDSSFCKNNWYVRKNNKRIIGRKYEHKRIE